MVFNWDHLHSLWMEREWIHLTNIRLSTEGLCGRTRSMAQDSRIGDRRHWYQEFGLKCRKYPFGAPGDGGGIKGPSNSGWETRGPGERGPAPSSPLNLVSIVTITQMPLTLNYSCEQEIGRIFTFHLDDSTSCSNSYCGPPKEGEGGKQPISKDWFKKKFRSH